MNILNLTNAMLQDRIPKWSRGVGENCHWQSANCERQTFCVANQKGGVGKSSACFHLAGAYSDLGFRVLVIDVDPQGSISQGFFGSEAIEQLPDETTTAALFDEAWGFCDLSKLIQQTSFERINIVCANLNLADHNTPCLEDIGVMQFALREFIEEQTAYDIVLLDSPPNLYRCTWTAMVAADWVIIPVNPEDFGTQGLRAVHQAIENARVLNPSLRRLGHLVTRSDGRLVVHKFYEHRLRKLYGELVMRTVLPELSAFKVAVADRTPVSLHSPKSRAARLTRKLSREILDRTDVRTQKQRAA